MGYLSDWAHTPKIAVEHSGISSGRAHCTKSNEKKIHVRGDLDSTMRIVKTEKNEEDMSESV